MNANEVYTKNIFDIIAKLKRVGLNNYNPDHYNDIRPSEEMFLIQIEMLSKNKKIKITDIINNLKFAPSTISTFLKALEDNKYITREINNDNRREVFVIITDKGLKRITKSKKSHFDTVNDLINYLGKEDTEKLIAILDKTVLFLETKKQKEGKNNNDKIN